MNDRQLLDRLDAIYLRQRRIEDKLDLLLEQEERREQRFNDRYETSDKVAERFGYTAATIRNWVNSGKVDGFAVGATMYIPTSQFYINPFFEKMKERRASKKAIEEKEIDREQYFIKYGCFPGEESA